MIGLRNDWASAGSGRRWLGLLLLFRALATAVAIALLAVQYVTPQDELLIIAVPVYVALTGALLLRRPAVARSRTFWCVDVAVCWGLLAGSGDWRSAFFLLSLTALALPAAGLGRRRAALLGAAATVAFAVIARIIGPDPLSLGTQISLETLTTHLVLPGLVCLGIGSAGDVMRQLDGARARIQRLAIEAERRRIAWELHDSAKQRIHAANLLLSAIGELDDERVAELVGLATDELRAASADMDTSLAELRTPLAGRPLGQALRERAAQLAVAGGPAVTIDGELEGLSPVQTAHAYRIAAEAVTNAIRHADAHSIRVALEATGDGGDAVVTVTDDGCGMPAESRPGATGMLAMRNRAETIDGTLAVTGGDGGRGTSIQLTFPITLTEEPAP